MEIIVAAVIAVGGLFFFADADETKSRAPRQQVEQQEVTRSQGAILPDEVEGS